LSRTLFAPAFFFSSSNSHMEAIVARYGSSSDEDEDDEGNDELGEEGDREQQQQRLCEATTTTTTGDDASALSFPRSRSFPHVEGNYAVHVYLPVCLSPGQARGAIALVNRVNSRLLRSSSNPPLPIIKLNLDRRLESFATSTVSSTPTTTTTLPPLPLALHLSLSRCAPLTRPQWHSFLEALRTCLTAEEAEFSSKTISLAGLAVLVNDRRATTFLALGDERASSPSYASRGAVTALVRAVDAAAALCGIPPLRDERHESGFVPHVSLGWAAGDEAERVKAAAAAAAEKVEEEERIEEQGERRETLRELLFPVRSVVCRVGKREHVVWP
jgi:U6 snRNA phosphodiesterase